MSVSIYYQAQRATPLDADEIAGVSKHIAAMSVDDKIEAYLAGAVPDGHGGGLNWESFSAYDPATLANPTIFEGSTKLPDNTEDAMWIGIQHWCELLTQIRRSVSSATWDVRVEDHVIKWDEANQRFDPRA